MPDFSNSPKSARPEEDKAYILTAILLALFLGALDQTIVATALPRIVEDLQGLSRFSWVATAYIVASTSLVPVFGKLADLYSRKRLELVSISLFLFGSVLCGLAGQFGSLPLIGDGMNQLIIFRALQGAGGAGIFSMAFIIIADLFPPSVRGKYQGYLGATFGIASVVGPWLGGLLTDYGGNLIPGIAGWRWVFYVNLPLGALALGFILKKMPPMLPSATGRSLDLIGGFLLLTGLIPLMIGLQLDKRDHPWFAPETIVLFAVAVTCLALFSLRCLRSDNPLLEFSLFRNPVFARANGALFLLGGAFFGIIIFLPLFMVNVIGVSATGAGLSLVPLTLGVVSGAVAAGHLVSHFGHYRLWMLGGGTILLVGTALLAGMGTETGYGEVIFYTTICGLGIGPALPLYSLAIQNAVETKHLGQATSASMFFRQIGGASAAAVLGTVLSMTLISSFLGGLPAEVEDDPARTRLLLGELLTRGAPGVEEAIQNGLTNTSLKAPPLRLEAESIDQLSRLVRESFGRAITRIYFFTWFFVAGGVLITVFVPELKLRET